ncbi:MAG: hypothetical protein A2268_14010 [Candidatus Raymondbacteria bacterium RifOxyA12_full_50_37]|uniref:HTH cro/C1-type domain-containing protein n=1 Tax=Candidatus Raymondbacteria bacterium RIFOXYD12_FULL_49_13 TaxID=1817890 RepID=A0A1F7FKQ0_UNCRA|nr:MAG: hypothetical protein A2268_14010 [Candidatus Raymondbacteria bacterium RifOxyA12_full_50_37]OGJ88194.1 MAG: hypothetical protein A2248_19350 [Candidatus Raymondbacteria bacterium RIFOXYA2_FULL_49_16]OGJ93966.1 MAG: hypothetical protein A2487_08770 [Candidatus Raymondbacteria bacterium RifOxyC12_full_50_8]OGJ98113.1 MAG: hypothetical protein A2350_00110 [Candidatus Raymondbacteria bacterium RifOxyB12_full_50_8]OGK07240.1 MAG: hypothetical protein A2519_14015 [Candidatus Raymondbacteria b
MISAQKEYLRRIRDCLKERRIALSLKQSDAAEKAGLRLRTLRQYEQTGKISFDKLLKLLAVYRMDSRVLSCIEDRTWWSIEELERAETGKRVR